MSFSDPARRGVFSPDFHSLRTAASYLDAVAQTDLVATLAGPTLRLSGTAAPDTGNGSYAFYVTVSGLGTTAEDTDGSAIALPSDLSGMRRIDLSAVTGAGVDFTFDIEGGSIAAIGTAANDSLMSFGGAVTLRGGAGDDLLAGDKMADVLIGGAGNDTLRGNAGDDTLAGRGGDDLILGGGGRDMLLLTGARSEYRISIVAGDYVITDLRAGHADGQDTIGNVEMLQFSDQTIALPHAASALQAAVTGGTLILAGTPFVAENPVTMNATMLGGIRIYENNLGHVGLPIDGDLSQVNRLDASGLETGLYLRWYLPGTSSVTATEQADYINVDRGAGTRRVQGLGGNDVIIAGRGNDTLLGGSGDDFLRGGHGDDRLSGQKGNDSIFGDQGADTVVFAGNRADYLVTQDGSTWRVEDVSHGGGGGVDVLTDVEFLEFRDGVMALTEATNAFKATQEGSILVISGAAARTEGLVSLYCDPGICGLSDNDAAGTTTSLGYLDGVSSIDCHDLQGAGISMVFFDFGRSLALVGSAQADQFLFDSDHGVTISGGGGDDGIFSGRGDDLLTGGAGNDMISGSAGTDTVIFSGMSAEYDLISHGSYIEVVHARGTASDGTDTIYEAEFLRFADGSLAMADLL
ncbi:hemolysin type calcium-binding protein [Rhodobacter viridis]|uniref:Hemolysin type calcium-binding protein n=1 Tax=Rhodobacter viridis TaxID=1054202 RepID=A0A318U2W0_9RHOB|nr:calcium-binding protein [Rhodobacter viridis]PYF12828.1 hemolysin type calcium-binding protein [Rhodobacter viridis]